MKEYPNIKQYEVEYEGVVYKSVRKTIELDDSTQIVRDVIVKPACVVALVRHVEVNNVIVVKEFRVGTMQEEYGFPAGFIDEGETPMEAIIREVTEETGYVPVKVEYLGESMTSSGFTDEKIYHFYIEVDGVQDELNLDHDENIEVRYGKFEDIADAFTDGWLKGNHAHATYLKFLLKYNMIKELD